MYQNNSFGEVIDSQITVTTTTSITHCIERLRRIKERITVNILQISIACQAHTNSSHKFNYMFALGNEITNNSVEV